MGHGDPDVKGNMSKIITSPVSRFQGTVKLADPLTFPQSFAFEDAISAAEVLGEASQSRINYALLPGILACVEEWHLDGVNGTTTIENFPATPRRASAELVAWLVREIIALYQEAETVPLAS